MIAHIKFWLAREIAHLLWGAAVVCFLLAAFAAYVTIYAAVTVCRERRAALSKESGR